MIHRHVLFIALLLPIQFAWSAATAYCEHEPASSSQAGHFGHHDHAHQGESKSPSTSKPAADPDCAACHTAATPFITANARGGAVVTSKAFTSRWLQSVFSSAPARAPDRPQWLRLV